MADTTDYGNNFAERFLGLAKEKVLSFAKCLGTTIAAKGGIMMRQRERGRLDKRRRMREGEI